MNMKKSCWGCFEDRYLAPDPVPSNPAAWSCRNHWKGDGSAPGFERAWAAHASNTCWACDEGDVILPYPPHMPSTWLCRIHWVGDGGAHGFDEAWAEAFGAAVAAAFERG